MPWYKLQINGKIKIMKMITITKQTGRDATAPVRRAVLSSVLGVGVGLAMACSTSSSPAGAVDDERSGGPDDAGGRHGRQLVVELAEAGRTWVDLAGLEIYRTTAAADVPPEQWDIAFEGWDMFTNSGPSGPGGGAAFGPLDDASFASDSAPEVPFLREDATGGAFLDWYTYDGVAHQLWSRHHVFGVRRGRKLYKVQLLGYYGEVLGAPVSALYRLRYAEVSEEGSATPREVVDLDATAGYPEVTDDAPSGCLNLESGERLSLTPSQARASRDWDLCFRRDAISVNGEHGGPGETAAVDLDAGEAATLDAIKERTPERIERAFDEVSFADLSDPKLVYRGDHVVSAFTGLWVDNPGDDAEARDGVWLVRGRDGASLSLLALTGVQGTAAAATRVALQVKHLEAPETP